MIRLFINALAATAGGGITYVRNLVPELAARRDLHTTLLVPATVRGQLPQYENVEMLEHDIIGRAARRFWREQCELPALIRASRADILISTGNFALRKSPVPQILLSRNSLYTSRDFFSDVWRRGEYRMWLETKIKSRLAKASVRWADVTVAPSQAFADELSAWTGRPVTAIHHGFDHQKFLDQAKPLPSDVQEKLASAQGALKLLFVSHYNYYRNFETLLRAVPLIRKQLASRPVRLFLTCKLRSQDNPGSYRAEAAAALVQKLGVLENVVQLGTVPYESLSNIYKACDLYVTAAYAETFSHPLVEAMSCGLPIVASDIPAHREIVGPAGLFFPTFSPESLANRVVELLCAHDGLQQLIDKGCARSQDFSWATHATNVVLLATQLLASKQR
jgi:glycosyltransferase involved in cell wall biosynthesis